jgi:hypothetical protein
VPRSAVELDALQDGWHGHVVMRAAPRLRFWSPLSCRAFGLSVALGVGVLTLSAPSTAAKHAKDVEAKHAKDVKDSKDVDPKDAKRGAKARDTKTSASADEPKKVRSSKELHVKAKDLKLNDSRTNTLRRIAEFYFARTHVALIATGGTRTPGRQAELMYAKFKHGDDVKVLYENKSALAEIQRVYEQGKHKPKGKVVREIREVIEDQITRGVYISRHLQFGAVDIRSRGMSTTQESAFRAAVAKESHVILLDERTSPEPHFHLSLGAETPRKTPESDEPRKAPESDDAKPAPAPSSDGDEAPKASVQ